MLRPIRLAVRGIIMNENRLLLVNAWKGRTHLWCAPGGGAEPHQSLTANLKREIYEETGLGVMVGAPCLVNEFHDPGGDFHQVDIYFRCTLISGDPEGDWTDPEGVVSHRKWVTREELKTLRVKPDSLAAVAWEDPNAPPYDALEPILR
ncbi:NUDIX hydrolase [Marivivens sp. LCG002]|uniref:NUDIX domain-containing protein n=1 Tax=Marivivens sp. LCG002 TaxID=3051171 RepID=UPI002554D237|nr:NUDIX hydrolase [Marivivens sp. LCG002]WIV50094.1 NUDIX hydrolase [Marivivens sp. LCG002]